MAAGKELFAQLMRLQDEQLDLGLAALLIAQEEYPELEPRPYLERLEELAAEAKRRLSPDMPAAEVVERLARLLAWEQGFRGNREDYYDPRNSFLNDVLERRTGIPITLAVVYIEVGRRAGLPVEGLGFPMHFLARYGDTIFDPFHEGQILDEAGLRGLLAQLSDGTMDLRPGYLLPTPRKQIVQRMLNNLKQIYLQGRYYRKAIRIMDLLLLVDPKNYHELRDRGAVHAELKNLGQARADLELYLRSCNEREEVFAVREAIANLDKLLAMMDD